MKTLEEGFNILSAPLGPEETEWRYGSASRDGTKFSVLCYLTSRTVQERFDQAFGPMGWRCSFLEIQDGFICTIGVKDTDGTWVEKSDGAQLTAVEKLKGGISSAQKRCAVQWQLGRSLYSLPKVFIMGTDKYIPSWAIPMLNALLIKFNSGGQMPPVVVLKKEDASKFK